MREWMDREFSSNSLMAFCVCCIVFVFAASSSAARDETTTIVIRGSGTLSPIVEKWAASYSLIAPEVELDIVAEGSEDGLRELLEGRADIAMASRPMTPEELSVFREKGLTVHDAVVARMGIAVVVNPANPLSSASVKQVAGVFAGEIQNWSELGGPDEAITVVRKESGWSPSFFQIRVMGGNQYLSGGLIVDSKEAILNEVSQQKWAIGVTGMAEAFPALNRVSLLRLKSDTTGAEATFALSRPLFFYFTGDSASVQAFLEYVNSDEAQESISETGFFRADARDRLDHGG